MIAAPHALDCEAEASQRLRCAEKRSDGVTFAHLVCILETDFAPPRRMHSQVSNRTGPSVPVTAMGTSRKILRNHHRHLRKTHRECGRGPKRVAWGSPQDAQRTLALGSRGPSRGSSRPSRCRVCTRALVRLAVPARPSRRRRAGRYRRHDSPSGAFARRLRESDAGRGARHRPCPRGRRGRLLRRRRCCFPRSEPWRKAAATNESPAPGVSARTGDSRPSSQSRARVRPNRRAARKRTGVDRLGSPDEASGAPPASEGHRIVSCGPSDAAEAPPYAGLEPPPLQVRCMALERSSILGAIYPLESSNA